MGRKKSGGVGPQGLGERLKTSVDRTRGLKRAQGAAGILLNRARFDVFAAVCAHPLSRQSVLARVLNIPASTLRWHLHRLCEAGVVSGATSGRTTAYYPSGLVSAEEAALLASAADGPNRRVVRALFISPGIGQRGLVRELGMAQQSLSRTLGRLRKAGLVSSVRDGRYSRYFPSEGLKATGESGGQRTKGFKARLLALLRREGFEPELITIAGEEWSIEVTGPGGAKRLLRVHTNPLLAVLRGR